MHLVLHLVIPVVLLASLVGARGRVKSRALAVREPSTNAQAFARGLPPLRPRRQGSRTWSAVKRQQSPIIRNIVLNFDDAAFTEADGPLPASYQGVNLACVYPRCGYVQEASFPAWTSNSAPNSMFFYVDGYPNIAAPSGGLLRLKSLFCTQATGQSVPLVAIGIISGETQYQQVFFCTANGENPTPQPPSFSSFDDLPLVDTILIRSATPSGSWAIDDISLTLIA